MRASNRWRAHSRKCTKLRASSSGTASKTMRWSVVESSPVGAASTTPQVLRAHRPRYARVPICAVMPAPPLFFSPASTSSRFASRHAAVHVQVQEEQLAQRRRRAQRRADHAEGVGQLGVNLAGDAVGRFLHLDHQRLAEGVVASAPPYSSLRTARLGPRRRRPMRRARRRWMRSQPGECSDEEGRRDIGAKGQACARTAGAGRCAGAIAPLPARRYCAIQRPALALLLARWRRPRPPSQVWTPLPRWEAGLAAGGSRIPITGRRPVALARHRRALAGLPAAHRPASTGAASATVSSTPRTGVRPHRHGRLQHAQQRAARRHASSTTCSASARAGLGLADGGRRQRSAHLKLRAIQSTDFHRIACAAAPPRRNCAGASSA